MERFLCPLVVSSRHGLIGPVWTQIVGVDFSIFPANREIYREIPRIGPLFPGPSHETRLYISNLWLNSLIDQNREFSEASREQIWSIREVCRSIRDFAESCTDRVARLRLSSRGRARQAWGCDSGICWVSVSSRVVPMVSARCAFSVDDLQGRFGSRPRKTCFGASKSSRR
jgi:hypothetical protein